MIENSEIRKIKVFGSHTIKVPADIAVINFSFSEKNYDPQKVVTSVIRKSKDIHDELVKRENIKIGMSRVILKKKTEKVKGKTATIHDYFYSTIEFTVTTKEIEKIVEIQQSVIALGVSDMDRISFQTSKLKAYRAAARKLAIRAAKKKAELYCKEVEAKVGNVLSIVDMNPDYFEFSRAQQSHYNMINQVDEADTDLVTVSGTVEAEFEIV